MLCGVTSLSQLIVLGVGCHSRRPAYLLDQLGLPERFDGPPSHTVLRAHVYVYISCIDKRNEE